MPPVAGGVVAGGVSPAAADVVSFVTETVPSTMSTGGSLPVSSDLVRAFWIPSESGGSCSGPVVLGAYAGLPTTAPV